MKSFIGFMCLVLTAMIFGISAGMITCHCSRNEIDSEIKTGSAGIGKIIEYSKNEYFVNLEYYSCSDGIIAIYYNDEIIYNDSESKFCEEILKYNGVTKKQSED